MLPARKITTNNTNQLIIYIKHDTHSGGDITEAVEYVSLDDIFSGTIRNQEVVCKNLIHEHS